MSVKRWQVPTPTPDNMQVSVAVVSGDADLYIKHFDPSKCVLTVFLLLFSARPNDAWPALRACAVCRRPPASSVLILRQEASAAKTSSSWCARALPFVWW
jgi:hypothetical protein